MGRETREEHKRIISVRFLTTVRCIMSKRHLSCKFTAAVYAVENGRIMQYEPKRDHNVLATNSAEEFELEAEK